MIITLSGYAGSGKSTIGRALAKRLNYRYYDIGDFQRKIAKKTGMNIEELNKIEEKNGRIDRLADDYTIKLAKTKDNFVIQGRVAFHFIPESVKIFLTVSDDVAAKRMYNDKSAIRETDQKASNMKEELKLVKVRNDSDKKRYNKYYGIKDFADPKHYDLIVDTTHEHDIEKNVDKIMHYLKLKDII